jgi:acyl-coenzyme A thioesterase PaaI-like protein
MNPQQIAEQSVRQFLGDDTVAQSLGITVSHIALGEVTAHLTVTAGMLNGDGSAHGSIIFTVADTASRGARCTPLRSARRMSQTRRARPRRNCCAGRTGRDG